MLIDLMSPLNRLARKWLKFSRRIGVLVAICIKHARQKHELIKDEYRWNQLGIVEICWYNGKRSLVYFFHIACVVWISRIFFHCLQTSLTLQSEKSSRNPKIFSKTSTGSVLILASFELAGLLLLIPLWLLFPLLFSGSLGLDNRSK